MDFSKSVKPSKGLSASIMPLSHGIHHQGTSYESSAFFLENNATGKSILIFGDVEPDSVSGLSLNKDIWIESAKRMSAGRLNAMLIECSYCVSLWMLGHVPLTDSHPSMILVVIAAERTIVWSSDANVHSGRIASPGKPDTAVARTGCGGSQRSLKRSDRYGSTSRLQFMQSRPAD